MVFIIYILTVGGIYELKKIYLLIISKFIFYLVVLSVNMISKFHQYQEIDLEILKSMKNIIQFLIISF